MSRRILLVNNRVVSSVLEQREHTYESQKVLFLKLLSMKKITHLGELIIYIYCVCIPVLCEKEVTKTGWGEGVVNHAILSKK